MITHIVMWRFKAEDAEGKAKDFALIKEALDALPALIPQIRSMRVHYTALPERDGFEAGLVSEFDSVADMDAYIVHPDHQKVIELIRPRVTDRAVLDFEA